MKIFTSKYPHLSLKINKMFNSKILLAIAALLVTGIIMASAAKCPGCLGDDLVKAVDRLTEKKKCWLENENHMLLHFKLSCLNGVADIIEDLYRTSYNASREECRLAFEPPCLPASDDVDILSACTVTNMRAMIRACRDLEQCNGKALDPTDADILFKVVEGSIVGWNKVHPEC